MNKLSLSKKTLSDLEELQLSVLDIDNISVVDDLDIQEESSVSKSIYLNIECKVKWFKQEDGYGFLKSKSFAKEIFIHSSVLDPTEVNNLSPGDVLMCDIVHGMRGPQVDVVHSYTPFKEEDNEPYLEGTIKWFNVKSDFGFIKGSTASGDRDVFLPGKKARSVGIKTDNLYPNQPVMFTFKTDLKDNFVVQKIKLVD